MLGLHLLVKPPAVSPSVDPPRNGENALQSNFFNLFVIVFVSKFVSESVFVCPAEQRFVQFVLVSRVLIKVILNTKAKQFWLCPMSMYLKANSSGQIS